MALPLFPTCLFAPSGIEADLERRVISGGTSLSGDEDVVATDGGGRVFIELRDLYLDNPSVARAYRALSAQAEGGATAFQVPICDARHQPTSGPLTITHSDGAPFSDTSLYVQSDGHGSVAGDAALRATSLTINLTDLPRPLDGGEWFGLDHPTMRFRAYRIVSVEQTGTVATVKFRPPLRDTITAGSPVTFDHPPVMMRLDGEMRSPSTLGYAEAAQVRFVEHFPGPEGYANG